MITESDILHASILIVDVKTKMTSL